MNESEARRHPAFSQFWDWATEHGAESDHFADWGIWWECYLQGWTDREASSNG